MSKEKKKQIISFEKREGCNGKPEKDDIYIIFEDGMTDASQRIVLSRQKAIQLVKLMINGLMS